MPEAGAGSEGDAPPRHEGEEQADGEEEPRGRVRGPHPAVCIRRQVGRAAHVAVVRRRGRQRRRRRGRDLGRIDALALQLAGEAEGEAPDGQPDDTRRGVAGREGLPAPPSADDVDGRSELSADQVALGVPRPAVVLVVRGRAWPLGRQVLWADSVETLRLRAALPLEAAVPLGPREGHLPLHLRRAGDVARPRLLASEEHHPAGEDAVSVPVGRRRVVLGVEARPVRVLGHPHHPEEGASAARDAKLDSRARGVVPLRHQLHVVGHHLLDLARDVAAPAQREGAAALLPRAAARVGVAAAAGDARTPVGAVAGLRRPVGRVPAPLGGVGRGAHPARLAQHVPDLRRAVRVVDAAVSRRVQLVGSIGVQRPVVARTLGPIFVGAALDVRYPVVHVEHLGAMQLHIARVAVAAQTRERAALVARHAGEFVRAPAALRVGDAGEAVAQASAASPSVQAGKDRIML